MSRISGYTINYLKEKGYQVELSPVSIFLEKEIEFCIDKNIPVLKFDFKSPDIKNFELSLYTALNKKG